MEAQRSQPGRVARSDEPPTQSRRVEAPGEGHGGTPDPPVRWRTGAAKARDDLRHFGDQGDGPGPAALRRRHGPVRERPLDADRALLEVDVPPAQRDELTAPQADERGGEEQRGVLLGRRRPRERVDLLGRVEVKRAAS